MSLCCLHLPFPCILCVVRSNATLFADESYHVQGQRHQRLTKRFSLPKSSLPKYLPLELDSAQPLNSRSMSQDSRNLPCSHQQHLCSLPSQLFVPVPNTFLSLMQTAPLQRKGESMLSQPPHCSPGNGP
jgi:hypothetical protein